MGRAADFLAAAITDAQPVDGRMVFSVFGGGAFVLEASRDGAGIALSELETGARVVIGSDPGASTVAAGSSTRNTGAGVSLLESSVAIEDENPVTAVIGSFTTAFGAAVGTVKWFAESPLRLLLLLPLLLLGAAVELIRRGRSWDTASQIQDEAATAPAPVEPGAARQQDPQRRRRRRKRPRYRRKRSVWRALVSGVRESLGFPEADQVRETDFKARKQERSRRRAHQAL